MIAFINSNSLLEYEFNTKSAICFPDNPPKPKFITEASSLSLLDINILSSSNVPSSKLIFTS